VQKMSRKTERIITIVISAGMLIFTGLQWTTNYKKAKNYEKRVERLEHKVDSLNDRINEKDNRIDQLYSESLRKYANDYREIINKSSRAIEEYKKFAYNWGPGELGDKFPEERKRRLNELKGKLEAIVDHVQRYRLLLDPFAKSLDGTINTFNDELAGDNETDIFRTFNTIKESAESQIGALEIQLDKIGKMK
jgi:Mg2+ and Co2+ transporter CorA